MDPKFIEQLLMYAITAGIAAVVGLLWKLNQQVAVMVERTSNQAKRLDNHEDRLKLLEEKRRRG